jgi:hypothetical protein
MNKDLSRQNSNQKYNKLIKISQKLEKLIKKMKVIFSGHITFMEVDMH